MSQFVPFPSDPLPILPDLADQSNNDQSTPIHPTDDASPSAEEQPLKTHGTQNDPRPDALAPHSRDICQRIFADYQCAFPSIKASFALGTQLMPPHTSAFAAVSSPRVSLPPPVAASWVKEYSTTMAEVSRNTLSSAFGATLLSPDWQIGHQMQEMLQPARTMMAESVRGVATEVSSTIGSMLVEVVRSNSIATMELIGQSFKSMMPSWNAFSLASTFPVLNMMKHFSPMSSFLPDMSWVKTLTDSINTALIAFPDWMPNIRGWKERVRQRLLAAFRLIGICFAPSMSEDLMYQIADQVEAGNKRSSITLLIWNYYYRNNHARLQQAVDRWQDNPLYARIWRDYLLPAFRAHVRGEYGLSISALAPRVEGISSHVVKKNMILPQVPSREGVLGLGSPKSVILRALNTAGDEANLESDATDIAHWMRVKSAVVYVEDIFCKKLNFERDYDFIHQRDHQVNRHAQVHGIQIHAATALNSLRLFLLLDTMYDLLQKYSARGGII